MFSVLKSFNISFQAKKSGAIPDMMETDTESGMTEVERQQYKAYKELKQRIERERQLAVVQVCQELGTRVGFQKKKNKKKNK